MSVNIDQLANAIVSSLENYTEQVKQEIEVINNELSNKTIQELKSKSPVGDYAGGGDYAKGWQRKKTKNGYVMYNKTEYRLTHLLEYGHVTRDGGRSNKFPHIRPTEEKIVNEYENRVREAVRS